MSGDMYLSPDLRRELTTVDSPPNEWVEEFIRATRQYPQNDTIPGWGIAVAMLEGGESVDKLNNLRLSKDQVQKIEADANAVHDRMGIKKKVSAERYEGLWDYFYREVLVNMKRMEDEVTGRFEDDAKLNEVRDPRACMSTFAHDLKEVLYSDPDVKKLQKVYRQSAKQGEGHGGMTVDPIIDLVFEKLQAIYKERGDEALNVVLDVFEFNFKKM